MPRSEEVNQRIREERRAHILDTSVRVFARKGPSATKIADIATAGEMSQGLIYRYFENKEEIFAALIERALKATVNLAEYASQQPGTPLEKLRWLLQQYVVGLWNEPDYGMMITHALIDKETPQEVLELALQQSRLVMKVVLQLIIEGQAMGEVITYNPETLTMMVLACIQGLNVRTMMTPIVPKFTEQPDPEIILRMIRS